MPEFGNQRMNNRLGFEPVSFSGGTYVRFVTVMESRPEGSGVSPADRPYEMFFGLETPASIWTTFAALKHPA
ncbi:hypothetical protein RZS08_02095, partial [Arthrospira platensis SPKY1]|nr:hypothetical protein [Arthrospira platensis SPKY1]